MKGDNLQMWANMLIHDRVWVKTLSTVLLIIFVALGSSVGCGGGGTDGGDDSNGISGNDCPDISGSGSLVFTETANDCEEPLEPPFIVTGNVNQTDCSLSGTLTEDTTGDTIPFTGTINSSGTAIITGMASIPDTGTTLEFTFDCTLNFDGNGDLIEGLCSVFLEAIDDATGDPLFSCTSDFNVTPE